MSCRELHPYFTGVPKNAFREVGICKRGVLEREEAPAEDHPKAKAVSLFWTATGGGDRQDEEGEGGTDAGSGTVAEGALWNS